MNRRKLLIQGGMALTGLGILPFRGLALAKFPDSVYPGERLVNLSSNENPYGPGPAARRAMADNIEISNRYQWDMISKLIAAIAQKNSVSKDNVLVGAGSTEILDIIVQFAASDQGSFVLAAPTFSRWAKAAERSGLREIAIPLTSTKQHDLNAMLQAITTDTKLIYICNPNNPTGTICERNKLLSFIEEATKKALVLVDEAYLDYSGETSLTDIALKNKNLVVVKTFSKIHGLAGGRVGYAIAHTDTIDQFTRLRSGANIGISAVSMAAAIASLAEDEFIKRSYDLNEKYREYTIRELERLNIPCVPSSTNFIYFSLKNYSKDFFAMLKDNNILGTKIFEERGKWSRISVGSMQEMEWFIKAIK